MQKLIRQVEAANEEPTLFLSLFLFFKKNQKLPSHYLVCVFFQSPTTGYFYSNQFEESIYPQLPDWAIFKSTVLLNSELTFFSLIAHVMPIVPAVTYMATASPCKELLLQFP